MAIHYTVKQVATILEKTPRMINQYIINGDLKARKIAGIYSISSKDLDNFFDSYLYSKRYTNKSRKNSKSWNMAMQKLKKVS